MAGGVEEEITSSCVLIVSLVEQLAQVHNSTAKSAMELLENDGLRGVCTLITDLFGPDIIRLLNYRLNADVICHTMKLCNIDSHQPLCHLYKEPEMGLKESIKQTERLLKNSDYAVWKNAEIVSSILFKICSLPVFKNICDAIDLSEPAEDYDQDSFSIFPSLRGYHWRGRDCNDLDKSIYPGRRPEDWDALRDSNCNGIWGFDPEDGVPYEKKFCDGSDAKGIVVLGDSAAAHFHIPPDWVTPSQFSKDTFSNMALTISNEFDWPQFSLFTGFQNSTIGGWTQSIYLKLRNWNRCNHRDYQNISKNGGSADNLKRYLRSLARSQEIDKPVAVFYGLIGNDVCNTHADTLKHMTTPAKMKADVMEDLLYLDTLLPNGSHVILMSLADGRFLWDTLHDRYHPIGQLNKDVTYAQFYDFLSCLSINPCVGWMNKNETIRNLTTERAEQLSEVLQDITASEKFTHFEVNYYEDLYQKVTAKWESLGRKPWQLLEPVDGFHPSQIASAVGADLFWEEAMQKWPGLFGKENPFNKEIIARFGDQGGY
ncbi:PREDICTED: acyloxyacyl hydrolase [Nanorana parkeri]|uniref:acyloxyacyl hydrolase n=1 Tax=Nanorana parkeri TaxID=125878 RepID=UPI0008544F64|nr:PREDICTED: acyloxyacyl hydrolase [Nanorana parkeri]